MPPRRPNACCKRCITGGHLCWDSCINTFSCCCTLCYDFDDPTDAAREPLLAGPSRDCPVQTPGGVSPAQQVAMQAPVSPQMVYQLPYQPQFASPQFIPVPQYAGMPQFGGPQFQAPQYGAPQYTIHVPPGMQAPQSQADARQAPEAAPGTPQTVQPQFTVNPIINVTPATGTTEVSVPEPAAEKKQVKKTVEEEEEEVEKSEKPWKRLLDRPTPEIKSTYEFSTILGRGSTGIVRQVKNRKTGENFACKSMTKAKMTKRQHVEDMKREIQVMHHLAGHPNVVKLHGVFEDRHNIHLVMDLCTGGELFDHILASGGYTEAAAASVMRTIIGVVDHCHKMGVIHRDIKPENFLWSDASFTTLKAIDFGLSEFIKPGRFFRDLVGSKYYVAPEVLRRSYNEQADVWSCGVVLYMMLSGTPPFLGDTLHEVFDNIIKGSVDYESPPWPDLTPEAKKCTEAMLTYKAKKRASTSALMQDPWMKVDGAASDKPVNSAVVQRIKGFSGMNHLQKIARKIIVRNLPMEQIEGLKNLFETLDADRNGTITAEELRTAVSQGGLSVPLEEFEQMLKAADVDGNGTVDYNEFLAATLNAANLAKEENLLCAFEHFDADNSGFITKSELVEALQSYGEIDNLEDILADVDKDQDGNIDYEEFKQMMLLNIGDF